ncbi:MAG TPA: hypothetical protein VJJ46_05655 [Anaerolineales bacterium]|nr:hypothetical protein [Anaerolineales bacterium]
MGEGSLAGVALVVVVVVALLLIFLSVAIRSGGRFLLSGGVRRPPQTLGSRRMVEGARVELGEHKASLVSEQIEELVRSRMAQQPELAARRIDFATGADGGLEIWLDDMRYWSVSEIPDPKIREIVAEAVASFNR